MQKYEETPGVTGKFGLGVKNEAGQRLIEFCQENALVIANTLFQQPKRRLYTWTSPDGQHLNQTDYILCSQRWRSSIQSAKESKMQSWMQSQKRQNDLYSFPRQTIQYHSNPSLCPNQ